jgi:ribosomal protein L12E/L44/L45/RPP1/RPP2
MSDLDDFIANLNSADETVAKTGSAEAQAAAKEQFTPE